MQLNPVDFLILVVDDMPGNLQILRGILEPAGYELTFACGGEQALERVETVQPDLILLDLMMPDVDGLSVCQMLHSNPRLASIPVIFLTASNEEKHVEKAFLLGAVDYLTKPFRRSELLARIRTHLMLKYTIDELRKTKAALLDVLQETEKLARLDSLTGALNRRSWQALAADFWQQGCQHGQQFSVLMLDCDRFKRINDTYGHEAGDRLLCAVAKTLEASLQPQDVLGRYGGEEFIILLPELTATQAESVAERLRQQVEQLALDSPRGCMQATISIGIASYRTSDRDVDALLYRADQAMYQAKADGRNCVRISA